MAGTRTRRLKTNPQGDEYTNWFTLAEYPKGVIICPLCRLPESTGVYQNECKCWDEPDKRQEGLAMAIETERATHPNPLWLQWYGDGNPEIDGEPENDNDVTWCRDKIFDHDIEYVPATRLNEVWATCIGIANVMAAGETYVTGRQKALNIAAALESARAESEKQG